VSHNGADEDSLRLGNYIMSTGTQVPKFQGSVLPPFLGPSSPRWSSSWAAWPWGWMYYAAPKSRKLSVYMAHRLGKRHRAWVRLTVDTDQCL